MTIRVQTSGVIDGEWLRIEPVRVGAVPATLATPRCFVTVTDDDKPVLRVDVYDFGTDCFAFQEAIVWRDNLIVGLGNHVHAISLLDRTVVSVALGSYFARLYPAHEYMLLASGERLHRMEPDRSLLWTSEPLGLDGVVVHETGPTVVRGDGEWDPPGGWRPFRLSVTDGRSC